MTLDRFFRGVGSPLAIPNDVIVALLTDRKGEVLITSESSQRVLFMVALKTQFNPSSVIVAMKIHLARRVSLLHWEFHII